MIYQPLRPDNAQEVRFYERYFDIPAPEFAKNGDTDIYIFSFNSAMFVEYQIKTLRQFYKDPFNLIIVDNNCWLHHDNSNDVKQLCDNYGVHYLKAPENYFQRSESFDPSMKLGTTMNWIYQQCIRKRNIKYFGFLDHDCFLIKPFALSDILDNQGMYGRINKSTETNGWNLHVTVNFFKYDFVRHLELDFRASWKYLLDTGGANYPILYKDYDPADYDIEQRCIRYAEQDVNRKDSVQHYEIIDRYWYHTCASSHDQLAGDGAYKLAFTKGFLDSRLL